MTGAYQDLCDYLAMDSKKCPLNEFFTDLKSFCTLFLGCLQENRLWREQEEKAKRAQNAKQRVDDIRNKPRAEPRAERNAYFKPSRSFIFSRSLILSLSLCSDDDDTDVFSNLMSVLKDTNMAAQPRRVRRPPGSFKFYITVFSLLISLFMVISLYSTSFLPIQKALHSLEY